MTAVDNKKEEMRKNMERMLNFMSRKYGKDLTEKQLHMALALLAEEDRTILEARWGIFDGKYCRKFAQLDEKLKRNDTRENYEAALRNLMSMLGDLEHTEVFRDCENAKPEDFGKLWRIIFAEKEEVDDTPIEELGLSRVTYYCLKRSNIDTAEDLKKLSEDDLEEIFGSRARIKEAVRMQKKLATAAR